MNDTLITSSGIIRNRSKPRSGIVSAHSLSTDFLDEIVSGGIDLSYETYRTDTLETLKRDNPNADEAELDELLDSEMISIDLDSHSFLYGAWVKDTEGQYQIDRSGASGSFALSYNSETNTVCVEWSQLTKSCNNTSPCYVMSDGSGPCGDLDTPGDAVLAYTLPADSFQGES